MSLLGKFLFITAFLFGVLPLNAYANPQGENVAAGSATFNRSVPNTLTINTASNNTIINYNSFSIASNETTRINQPSANSATLNRVIGVDPSEIYGTLSSNGRLFLVNPNGIIFGSGSKVNAPAILASTLDISNNDFLNGNYNFFKNGGNAFIINQGRLAASPGGYIALLSQAVNNQGVIVAPLGTVVLAAGEKMTLALDSQAQISVVVDDAVQTEVLGPDGKQINSAIQNSGKIIANGGRVLLTSKVLNDVFDYAVNNSGVIQARSLQDINGSVQITASGAPVINTGKIKATQVNISDTDSGFTNTGIIQANQININVPNSILINQGQVISQLTAGILNSGNISIQALNIQQDGLISADNIIDITADDVSTTAPFQNTTSSPVIKANQVNITANNFGSAGLPVAIDASNINFKRTSGDIDLVGSESIGSSVMITGPPGGFGSIIYNSDTSLTFEASSGSINISEGTSLVANNLTLESQNGIYSTGSLITPNTLTLISASDIYSLGVLESSSLIERGNTFKVGGVFHPGVADIKNADNAMEYTANTSISGTIPDVANIIIDPGITLTMTADTSFVAGGAFEMDSTSTINGWGYNLSISAVNNSSLGNINNVNLLTLSSGSGSNVTFSSSPNSTFLVNTVKTNYLSVLSRNVGTGTSSDPLMIYSDSNTPGGLQYILSSGLGLYYKLANNIDASETSSWNSGAGFMPLGNSSIPFTGNFNGQGFSIFNLFIYAPSSTYIGLFGYTSSSAVLANTQLNNVYVIGNGYTGGLVGWNKGSISSSSSNGTVSAVQLVGGLVGLNSGNISNSYSTGNVNGGYAGGLVGSNGSTGSIANSYSTVSVSSYYNYYAGGLAGLNMGYIGNSYSIGSVTGNSVGEGGLVGSNSGTISNSGWWTGAAAQAIGSGGTVSYNETNSNAFMNPGLGIYNTWDISNSAGHAWIMAGYPHLQIEWSPTITNVYQLQMMSLNLAASYTLANNIDASQTSIWNLGAGFVPVGSSSRPFTGSFNGNFNTVSNLYIVNPAFNGVYSGTPMVMDVGLFGYTAPSSIISNVGLLNANITTTTPPASVSYYRGVGTLVGYSYGFVTNSYATGTITGNPDLGDPNSYEVNFETGGFYGGLAGINQGGSFAYPNAGTISYSYADVNMTGGGTMGGLVGLNGYDFASASIFNSYAEGKINATSSLTASQENYASFSGGLVGLMQNNSVIANSYATGDVTGVENIGGLVGFVGSGGSISNSYAAGTVTNESLSIYSTTYYGGSSGGFVGAFANGTITNCSATGDVYGGYSTSGGLVGSFSGTISNSYATGNVSGRGTLNAVGGFVGDLGDFGDGPESGVISNSYATGNVIEINDLSSDMSAAGGFVGINDGLIFDSYSSGNVIGGALSNTTFAGGFAGITSMNNNSSIVNSYSTGFVTGGNSGGFVGFNDIGPNVPALGGSVKAVSSIINSAWYTGSAANAIGNDNGYGALARLSLAGYGSDVSLISSFYSKSQAVYDQNNNTGHKWDFVNIWDSYSSAYPHLKWENYGAPITGIDISGTVFDIIGGSALGSGLTIDLVVNGTHDGSASTNPSGIYSFSNISADLGNAILVYISGNATKGNTVTISNGSDISDLNIYGGALTLRHEIPGPITNSILAAAKGSLTDTDILYSVTGSNLTANTSIYIYPGMTYAPGGDIEVSGNWTNRGTFTSGTNTVTFNGSGTITSGGAHFYDMDFNNVSGSWSMNDALAVDDNFNIAAGTFTSDPALFFSVGNSFSITGSGLFNRFSGSGTSGDPYLIYDVYGLQGVEGYLGYDFQLANNIDATVTANWNGGAGFVPIGNYTTPFTGSFNGNGLTISNLFINTNSNYSGLFGDTSSSAKLSNIGLVNVNVTGGMFVGALVGENNGSISNSYSLGSVNGNGAVGGLAGDNYYNAFINNSYSGGNVKGNVNYIGGLTGENEGYINNSYSSVSVSGNEYVGGLTGENEGSIFTSYSTGNVDGYEDIGGFVGFNEGGIVDSFTTGNVSGTYDIGGLAGYNGNDIFNSYFTDNSHGDQTGKGLYESGGAEAFYLPTNPVYAIGTVGGWDILTPIWVFSGGLPTLAFQDQPSIYSIWTGATSSNWLAPSNWVGDALSGAASNILIDATANNPVAASDISSSTMLIGPGAGINFTSGSYNISLTGALTMDPASSIDGGGNNLSISAGSNSTLGNINNVNLFTLSSNSGSDVTFTSNPSSTFHVNTVKTNYHAVLSRSVGDGSSSNPIMIYSDSNAPGGLQDIPASGLSLYYEQANNIDASETANWNGGYGFVPIGSGSSFFTGTFNGNNKTISDLYINSSSSTGDFGLFGDASTSALIENIGLLNVNITTSTGASTGGTGALVGYNQGAITNSSAIGSVTNNNISENNGSTGGLVGVNSGTISYSSADVTVTGYGDAGGLVGDQFGGTITYSSATGNVTNPTTEADYATEMNGTGNTGVTGGLVGGNDIPNGGGASSYISYSHAAENVNGGYAGNAGGLVGMNESSYISSSYATGSVSASGAQSTAGGLAGDNRVTHNGGSSVAGTISNSYATGSVTEINVAFTDGSMAGGLVGDNDGNIYDSYATGNVKNGYLNDGTTASGSDTAIAGGLVGTTAFNTSSTIINSYSTGQVQTPSGDIAGGFVGYNDIGPYLGQSFGGSLTASSTIINSSWCTGSAANAIGNDSGNGARATLLSGGYGTDVFSKLSFYSTSAAVYDQSNSTGHAWDFVNIWQSYSSTYPHLKWENYVAPPSTGVTISGDAYSDLGLTGLGAGISINLVVNGTPDGTTSTVTGGAYSFSNIALSANEAVLVYIAGNTVVGDTVTVASNSTSDITGLNIYGNTLSLRSEDGSLVTNAVLATGKGSLTDPGIIYSVTGLSLTANSSVYINPNTTYAPGGDVSLSGNWTNAGTFTAGTSTVTLMGTGPETLTSGGGSFNNLTISGSGTVTQEDPLIVVNNFTQSNGTFISSPGLGFSVGNSFTLSGGLFNRFTGSGSSNDPYVIYDVYGLQGVEGYLSSDFKLANNIDALTTSNWNAGSGFVPIGISSPFIGIFNGNNDTISNLFINLPTTNNVGLFSFTSGSTIENLGLVNVNITGQEIVGGLVAYNDSSSISNSFVTGSVSGSSDNVGGLVGYNYNGSSITNCYATSSVSTDGTSGGLVGDNDYYSSISNSYATGSVYGGEDVGDIGGLVGYNFRSSSISNSYATGNVTGGATSIGGLVGFNYESSSISNSHATGNVNGGSNGLIGGLVGNNSYSTITNSYAIGSVNGNSYIGGLVGWNYYSSSITNSYASGSVSGNYYVGGLVGINYCSISGSYATGSVTGAGNINFIGGLVGGNLNSGSIFSSYSTGNVIDGNNIDNQGNIGGFVGGNYGSIQNSYSSGNVTAGDYNSAIGGFVGGNSGGLIQDSYSTGNVIAGIGSQYIGGFVGDSFGTIQNSYSTGNVNVGDNSYWIGGFVGYNQGINGFNSPIIQNSYSTGNVIAGQNAQNVGGFVGINQGSLQNSFTAGNVSAGENSLNVGGFVGGNSEGTITNGAWVVNSNIPVIGYDEYASAAINTFAGSTNPSVTGTDAASASDFYNPGFAVYDPYNTGGNTWGFNENGNSTAIWVPVVDNTAKTASYPILGWQTNAVHMSGDDIYNIYTYQITNVGQLELMLYNLSAHYQLANNINADIPGYNTDAGFIPVGSSTSQFTGAINGNNNIISNLFINLPTTNDVGLFGQASGDGTLTNNIGLVNVNITGQNDVGAFVGYNYLHSDIYNSYATGTVNGVNNVGGLVGFEGYYISVYNSFAIVSVSGVNNVGGLLGYNLGLISHSYATGNINGSGEGAGGLVGWSAYEGIIGNSYATGSVSGNTYVGGLVGSNQGGNEGSSISYSYSTGNVSGSSYVGGLVGANSNSKNGTIYNSYSTGSVFGGSYVGGLLGWNDVGGSVSNSFSTGNVSGTYSVGGLVGFNNEGSIRSSYSTGNVSSAQGYEGGLVGVNAAGTITNSYATGNVSGGATNIDYSVIGGLVGFNTSAALITDSYSTGSVSGSGMYIGGLAGYNDGSISNSFTTGNASGAWGVGGLAGYNSSSITNSYYTDNTGSAGGTYEPGGVAAFYSPLHPVYAIGTSGGWDIVTPIWDFYTNELPRLDFEQHSGNIYSVWTGATSTNWSTPSNWASGIVPGATADIFIDAVVNNPVAATDVNSSTMLIGPGATLNFMGGSYSISLIGALSMDPASTINGGGNDLSIAVGSNSTLGNINNVNLLTLSSNSGSDVTFISNSSSTFNVNTVKTDYLAVLSRSVGDGSSSNPIMIYSDSDAPGGLQYIGDTTNNPSGLGLDYKQANNIDASETSSWSIGSGFTPIGISSPFTGNFNGNNYTISNLFISLPTTNNVGVFGFTSGSAIENVGLVNVNITGQENVGGLVGYSNSSSISNSYVTGSVSGSSDNVGGLVGYNYNGSSISNSYAASSISTDGTSGGLVGDNDYYSSINNSYATGSVYGWEDVGDIGGLVGYNFRGSSITGSYATGNVSGGITSLGGLVGFNYEGASISNSYATGNVSAGSGGLVGGLVGNNSYSTISNSYATGNVSGSEYIGGLVGWNYYSSNITNSSAAGSVSGNTYVGGLVGINYGSVSYSNSTGSEVGGNYVGGLAGWNDVGASTTNSYSTGNISGSYFVGGLIGWNEGSISASYSTGSVNSSGYNTGGLPGWENGAGGLVGWNNGVITNSSSSGSVSGTDYVGGLVGWNNGAITNSSSSGSSSSIGYINQSSWVGGLVGMNDGSVINSYSNGNVIGNGYVGGLAGWNNGSIANSYSTGSVNGYSGWYVGGLVGVNYYGAQITNSYSTGNVSGDGGWYVGGLVGINYGPIANSYSIGSINSSSYDVGGLVGYNDGSSITNSFTTGNITGGSLNAGGLVGNNTGAITNSYFTDNTYGPTTPAGFGTYEPGGAAAFYSPAHPVYAIGTAGGWDITTPVWVFSGGLPTLAYQNLPSVYSIWTGATSSNWSTSSNWVGNTLPGAMANIIIDAIVYNLAAVSNINVSTVLIASGSVLDPATFTIAGTTLDVYGTLLVKAPTFAGNYAFSTTILESGSTVNYAGDQTIDPTLSYYNLILSGTGPKYLTGTTTVSGNFTIGDSAIFDPNGNTVTVGGNFVNNGIVALTVTGITAANKIYDGTTNATIDTSAAALEGTIMVGANAVALNTAGAIGIFNSKDVGIADTVSVSGLSLSGTDIGQYTLTQPTIPASIIPAPLTISAVADSKQYDGTTTSLATPKVNGLQGSADSVTGLSQAFASKDVVVGGNNTLVVTGYEVNDGNGGNDYTVTTKTAIGTITPAPLTINAVSDSKQYDGTPNSVLTPKTSTLYGIDKVTGLSQSFNSQNVLGANGSTISVNPSYVVNDGNNGNDYKVTLQTASGTITPAPLTISAVSDSKQYNGTTTSSLTPVTGKLYGTDTVTGLSQSFNSKNVLGTNGSTISVNFGYNVNDGNNGKNYTVTLQTASGTITPAPLTVTGITASNKVYDGTTVATLNTSKAIIAGVIKGDSVSLVTTSATGAFTDKNVSNTKTVTVSGLALSGPSAANYVLIQPTATANITPASLTVTASNQVKIYGTTATLTGFTTSGLFSGDSVNSVTLTSSGAAATATVTGSPYNIIPSAAVGTGLSNYKITYVSGDLSVNPAALTITANNATKTYGTTANLTGFTTSGLVNGNTVTGVTLTSTGAATTATVAGDPYSIIPSVARGTGLSNYTITYVSGSLIVNPATLTITASNATKTYGTTATLAGFTTSSLFNGDSVTGVTLASAGAASTAMVSGSPYSIIPSAAVGSGLSNYTITYKNGNLTVNPAALTITASNATKTYGTTATLTGFGISGLLNSDTVSSMTLTSAGAVATATVTGSPYNIIPSAAVGTGLSNYKITYVSGSLSVNPAALTITANNATKTYGTTANLTGFTTSGLVNGNTVTGVTLTSTGAATTATVAGDPYSIIPSVARGTGLSNYTITYVSGSLIVNPATLTITASNATKTYGTTTNLTGFTTSGLVNGNTVTSVTLTSTGAVATATVSGSPYSIMPSAAAGNGLSNYTIIYVPGNLIVNPAALTITASNATKTYGTTANLTGFSTNGLVNGDSVTGVILTSTGAAATATVSGGPYTITASNATGTGLSNYKITYVSGKLTVNPATLTITADNVTKVYGTTANLTGDYTVSGLVNGDTVTSVTLKSAGVAANAKVSGSPYSIIPSAAQGTGLSNYSIIYVSGQLIVIPASSSLTLSAGINLSGTLDAGTSSSVIGGGSVGTIITPSILVSP